MLRTIAIVHVSLLGITLLNWYFFQLIFPIISATSEARHISTSLRFCFSVPPYTREEMGTWGSWLLKVRSPLKKSSLIVAPDLISTGIISGPLSISRSISFPLPSLQKWRLFRFPLWQRYLSASMTIKFSNRFPRSGCRLM